MSDPRRQRRRRQRRAGAIVGFMVLALGLAWFFESQATTTVIFVRYADVVPGMGENPGLSPAGWIRAEELSRMLGDADVVAGVDAVFATRYRSTQETADPVARRLNLPVQVVDASDIDGMVNRLLRDYKGQIVLVVTEPDALPQLIARLHGSKKLPPMGDEEHDNLYVVSIPWYGKVKTLRFHYGAPPPSGLPPATAPGAAG